MVIVIMICGDAMKALDAKQRERFCCEECFGFPVSEKASKL